MGKREKAEGRRQEARGRRQEMCQTVFHSELTSCQNRIQATQGADPVHDSGIGGLTAHQGAARVPDPASAPPLQRSCPAGTTTSAISGSQGPKPKNDPFFD